MRYKKPMDADHLVYRDARLERLPAQHSAPEHPGPAARTVAATAVAAVASVSACCFADCLKELAVKSESSLVRY